MTTIQIPILQTENLVLRAPTTDDFEGYADVLASDRSEFLRGPYSRAAAWKDYCLSVAEWVLYGVGPFALYQRDTNAFAGLAGVSMHPDFPEPEMGWVMAADTEGKSLAYEAGVALRDWAFADLKLPTLVSYIWRGNTRAETLAKRLGGTLDPNAPTPWPGAITYRYTPNGARS
jgi:RimJ/RimL family protein N-acetyltransferase